MAANKVQNHYHQPGPDGGTASRARTPAPGPVGLRYVKGGGISYELQDAPAECVPTTLKVISFDEMRVLAWLQEHRDEIIAAEQKFNIDRRAIAGAIAFEALENIRGSWTPSSVGPGKIHIHRGWKWHFIYIPELWNNDTVVKQAEEAGYLPKRTLDERKKDLSTPAGAIMAIAGIMAAGADIAAKRGYDIRWNPVILTNFYQGADLEEWKKHLASKKPSEPLKGGNPMDLWVSTHLQYLEDAVGKSSLCAPAGSRP